MLSLRTSEVSNRSLSWPTSTVEYAAPSTGRSAASTSPFFLVQRLFVSGAGSARVSSEIGSAAAVSWLTDTFPLLMS